MNWDRFYRGPLMDPEPAPPGAPPPVSRQEDPEVARLRADVAKHKAEFETLKNRVMAPPAPPAPQGQPPDMQSLQREFYKDPINGVIAIAQGVMNRNLQARDQTPDPGADTLVTIAKNQAKTKNDLTKKAWEKYELEIEGIAAQAGPQWQKNSTVWENATKMVIGNHADELLQAPPAEEAPRAPAVHISKGQGPASPNSRPPVAPKSEELSSDEKRVAKKLGITEQMYIQGKKAVAEQNDQVSDPVGKSSWDDMITFDSKERNRKFREERRRAAERGAA